MCAAGLSCASLEAYHADWKVERQTQGLQGMNQAVRWLRLGARGCQRRWGIIRSP